MIFVHIIKYKKISIFLQFINDYLIMGVQLLFHSSFSLPCPFLTLYNLQTKIHSIKYIIGYRQFVIRNPKTKPRNEHQSEFYMSGLPFFRALDMYTLFSILYTLITKHQSPIQFIARKVFF